MRRKRGPTRSGEKKEPKPQARARSYTTMGRFVADSLTPQEQDELKREVERLRSESREALSVVEEIYGAKRPDMFVLPRRGG